MASVMLLAVFFGYLTGFVLTFLSFELQNEALRAPAKMIVLASIALHAGVLLLTFAVAPGPSITTLAETINVVAFLMITISFLLEWRSSTKFLLLFSMPVVLLFCLLAMLLSRSSQPMPSMQGSAWLWIHTGLILSGFTSLILSMCAAAMYLLQSAQLKSKQLGKVFLKMPSLDALDKLHFTLLSAGVVLFSLGIASGFFWAKEMQELRQILKDPKVSLSFLTCLMYWTVLSFRLSALRRGQKIAMGTLFIFIFLFITLMSSVYAPSGFHKGF